MSQASKSARSTARGSSVGSKSARSTARSNVSFAASEIESVHTDYDAEWREGPERCVFVIKPDALEQFESEIKEELEATVAQLKSRESSRDALECRAKADSILSLGWKCFTWLCSGSYAETRRNNDLSYPEKIGQGVLCLEFVF